MNVEDIAKNARRSISSYCHKECKSYCCRKGYLVLSEEGAELVCLGRRKELEEKGILHKMENKEYSLYMGNYKYPCPSLVDYKCVIHKNKKRPDTCKQFPFFIEGMMIKLSPRCPAVKEELFYPYVSQLLRLGYKVVKADQYSDMELYKFEPSQQDKPSPDKKIEQLKKINKPLTFEA